MTTVINFSYNPTIHFS